MIACNMLLEWVVKTRSIEKKHQSGLVSGECVRTCVTFIVAHAIIVAIRSSRTSREGDNMVRGPL